MVSFRKRIIPCMLLVLTLFAGTGFSNRSNANPVNQPAREGAQSAPQENTAHGSELASLKRQVELLQSALAPGSPKEAVETWARGVKARNGALQFAVLSPEIRDRMRQRFEQVNWVTGVSSPWVEKYTISKENKQDDNTWTFEVSFQMAASTGSAGTITGKVTVKRYGDFWFISDISR